MRIKKLWQMDIRIGMTYYEKEYDKALKHFQTALDQQSRHRNFII